VELLNLFLKTVSLPKKACTPFAVRSTNWSIPAFNGTQNGAQDMKHSIKKPLILTTLISITVLSSCKGPAGVVLAAPKSLIDGTVSFWSSATGVDLAGKDTKIKELEEELKKLKAGKAADLSGRVDFITPRLYEVAASTTNPEAIENFEAGVILLQNRNKKSIAQSIAYFKQAAKKSKEASYNLGVIYYKGEDVKRDLAEALIWWGRASNQGDVRADFWFPLALAQATEEEKKTAKDYIKEEKPVDE